MMKLVKKKIGEMWFGNTVTVTDPCYDDDVWCTKEVEVLGGNYDCIAWMSEKEKCVGAVGIYYRGIVPQQNKMEDIATVGVDAGLCGFFMNKPNYSDAEWHDFCERIENEGGDAWIFDEGFFSRSGYGDGVYPVYATFDKSGKATALEVRFL